MGMPYITDVSGNIYTPRSFQHTCNIAYLMYTRYAYMNIGLFECKQGMYKIRIKPLRILLSDWLKKVHRIHHTHECATYTILFWLYYIQQKIFFRVTIFLYYSPCPNPEDIKDALSYKFRRLTIGQSCCAVCTNEVARPRSLEWSERWCLLFIMVWW